MDFFVILANVGEARLDELSEQGTVPPAVCQDNIA